MSTDSSTPAGSGSDDPINQAIDYVLEDGPLPHDHSLGLALPLGSLETQRCQLLKEMIDGYEVRADPKRPLSIAVFGPPGSGKSTLVRALLSVAKPTNGQKSAQGEKPARTLDTVNLSQLSSPSDLARSFGQNASAAGKEATRLFFFDEFDTSLDNVPLGWLRWFLAPMQDAQFFADGKTIPVGKAVFVFAGGTAASRDEFEQRARLDETSYRALKVPDFMSRLRGFMDIQGVNNLDRVVRRALILKRNLDFRWPNARRNGQFPLDRTVVHSLLSGAHFVHGARSIEALLEMSVLDENQKTLRLPENDILKLHVSRGLLDGHVIGISAGQNDNTAPFLAALTNNLLQRGATLAYGGDFVPQGTLDYIVKAAEGVPPELVKRADRRIRNYLGFPAFLNQDAREHQKRGGDCVAFHELQTVGELEKRDLGVPNGWFPARDEPYNPRHHLAWALSLFRMRLRMTQDISALVVVGGKDDGRSWGRFPGIAEEVMLASALGKPVYVLGGHGGAAHKVGRLFGLDETMPNPEHCLTANDSDEFLSKLAMCANAFRIPGRADSPLTTKDLRLFLYDRSITTAGWRWNGLTVGESRELFAASIASNGIESAVRLIIRGLTRLNWTTTPADADAARG